MLLGILIWYQKHFRNKGNLKLIFPKTGWNGLRPFFPCSLHMDGLTYTGRSKIVAKNCVFLNEFVHDLKLQAAVVKILEFIRKVWSFELKQLKIFFRNSAL